MGRHVDNASLRASGQEAADRGRAANHGRLDVERDQVEHFAGRCRIQRRVAEHGGVVDPASEASRRLGEVRGSFGHCLIGGAAADRDEPRAGRVVHRPVQGTRVDLDHHGRMAVCE
jgi:hypothetical protein